MALQLRRYQQAAVAAVYDYLRRHEDNPCVVIPTAGGKTPVLATICKDAVAKWDGRVLVLAHVKELLQQAADKLRAICPEVNFGVYSAGLRRRDTEHPVIIAGIQSVYKRACELDTFDLIIVDEAHMIPLSGEGMYRQFLAEAKVVNPRVRTIGLTATPFRLKSGMICGPANILNAVCYEIGVKELIRDGYLCPLVTKAGTDKADTGGLHVRAGEFVAAEVEDLMDQDQLVESACREIIEYTHDGNSVLIFASGIKHAEHIQKVLQEKHNAECGFVCGKTPTAERDEILARFRGVDSNGLFHRPPLKYLVNVNVLTTGFDAPNIDCVALVRPTMSPGLYCLDSTTEVLTESGWKGMGHVQVGEQVAAFDIGDESIRFVPTLTTLERDTYENELFVALETPATSIRVTDQHRLIVSTRSRPEWRVEAALKTFHRANGVWIPKAGYLQSPGVPLTDDELRFIGWVMTDGNIGRDSNAITIVQSVHQPWVGEIQRVVQSCGFKHSLSMQHRATPFSRSSTMLRWSISKGAPRGRHRHLRGWSALEPWLSKDFSDRLLCEINARQFEVLLEAIHLGDGAKQVGQGWTRRSYHISTGNPLFAERLQICAITRGFRCTVSKHGYNKNSLWVLHLKKGTRACVASRSDGRPSWNIEQGVQERVWCVENELGTILTRRNGKVTILGNCQMVGRGFRLHPGKQNCLVLDFGGNVLRHGPVDQIRVRDHSSQNGDGEAPAKECPECHSLIAAGYATCPECGYEFPVPERTNHDATASTEGILSGQVTTEQYTIRDIYYSAHTKRGADENAPKTMRVDYRAGLNHWISEWICFEHTGYPRWKAEQWWLARSNDPIPDAAQRAVDIAIGGGLCWTRSITVRSVVGEPFERVIDYELCEKPEPCPIEAGGFVDEEVPF